MIQAKFKLDSITRILGSAPKRGQNGELILSDSGYMQYEPSEMQTISMTPVTRTDDPNSENSKFWSNTPSGKLELNCVFPDIIESLELELGKEYYLTISKERHN